MNSWLGEYQDWQQPSLPAAESQAFFVQGAVDEQPAVTASCSLNTMGAILTASTRSGASAAKHTLSEAAHRHVETSLAPVALDANRYSGASRRRASQALDPDWVDQQLTAGAAFALSDSGFVDDGALEDLDVLLGNARRLPYLETGRVRTVLAISSKALTNKTYLTELETRLRDFEHPLSLTLEHTKDPLGKASAVKGLLRIINASADISLNRADYSVFGAVAAGATFGAIGTKPSLRHIYPVPKKPGGGRRSEDISIVWPHGLSFHRASKLAEIIAFDRENIRWLCDCPPCEGRSIERLTITRRADEHNLAVGATIRDRLFPFGRRDNSLMAWGEMCAHAQTLILQLDPNEALSVPDYLGAWHAAIGDAVRVS